MEKFKLKITTGYNPRVGDVLISETGDRFTLRDFDFDNSGNLTSPTAREWVELATHYERVGDKRFTEGAIWSMGVQIGIIQGESVHKVPGKAYIPPLGVLTYEQLERDCKYEGHMSDLK